MTKPREISMAEWQEIMRLPEIRDAWGIEDDETAEQFASVVYGAKFDFVSGGPGYFGDLYVLQGDALTGDAPMVLIRKNGVLEVANSG
jgi:hypothetical protein